jgi:putative phosphoribosyl transferase
MYAAVCNVRRRGAEYIIVAAPVASRDSVDMLRHVADEVVVLDNPGKFIGAVGAHYRMFEQTDDMEVRQLLVEHSNVG